jgi:hypothetical protein
MAAINPKNTLEQYYYIDIFLTQTQKNLGQFSIITNDEIVGDIITFNFNNQNSISQSTQTDISTNITVTGLTSSRLAEVKTYTGDYKVGVNGVISVFTNSIIYKINDITYQTLLDGSNTTFYTLNKPSGEFQTQSVLRNDNSVSIDIKKTLNAFIIERSNISVYDYFNKINNCDKLDDLLDIF